MSQHPDQPTALTPVSTHEAGLWNRAIGKLMSPLKAIIHWTQPRRAKAAVTAKSVKNTPVMLTDMAGLEPAHLALLMTGLARRCTRLMTGIAPDTLVKEVANRINFGVGIVGQRPTTVVWIADTPASFIDHETGIVGWITHEKDNGTWLLDFSPDQRGLVSGVGLDLASTLTGAVMENIMQDGSVSRSVISAELASAIGRRLAPHIASALFNQVNAVLAAEVSRLTGPNVALFGWLMAGGDALRKELRVQAVRKFPLLSAMVTLLDPARFRTLEYAVDAGTSVTLAVAKALDTSEAVVMAACRIYPAMLGPVRTQRLFNTGFKAAASIPAAQLPGCDGVRMDIAWRAFIDTRIAGLGGKDMIGTPVKRVSRAI